MSEAKKQRAITELIDDLLQPEPEPTYTPSHMSTVLLGKTAVMTYWFMLFLGLLGFLVSIVLALDSYPDTTTSIWLDICVFVLLSVSGLLLINATSQSRLAEVQRANEFAYSQQVHLLRASQRTQLLQSLASVDVARYATEGAYNADDLTNRLRRDEQAFTASESELDRSHKLEVIDRQIDGDIRKAEADRKSARGARREKFDDTIDQLNSIKDIKNKTVRNQAYDAFKRGQN